MRSTGATSRFTSIKTRIETPRPVHIDIILSCSRFTSIKTRIETVARSIWVSVGEPSRFTSIKTRIETKTRYSMSFKPSSLASLPSKQGLKLVDAPSTVHGQTPLASLPSKQGLKPEAGNDALVQFASRFTSIKTRIETVRNRGMVTLGDFLSLHFHQNKD